jgi:predicted lipopolysaccharide heptosyltransferase III
MNSLRDILESSPQLRDLAMQGLRNEDLPQPLGPSRWNWADVKRVLLVRLRSIGDTVLATPCLYALKRFVPGAQVDILLEDWVAPLLNGFEHVDNIITLQRKSTTSRARVARQLRANRYDVVYNLHGGTTATLLTRASGAKHRVGYADYQYSRLHQHQAPSSASLWDRRKTHSVEQQLALLGWTGVPVTDRPATRLPITESADKAVSARLQSSGLHQESDLVLIHPTAAFDTKQWSTEKFARLIEMLASQSLKSVVITTESEAGVAAHLKQEASVPFPAFTNLSLPEVTALAARARLFVGNDSGIAHIAAAVGAPAVVIFGSSNVDHWRPWATAPAEVVREELDCQPCHGYYCEKFSQPECIQRVPVTKVFAAVERVLRESAK